jgi:hypothetical protein
MNGTAWVGRLLSSGTMRPMIAATRFGAPLPQGG